MEPGFFLKGAILGFSMAAPVGPIGVLCIRRTLSAGMIYGLFTGFGAATADCLYGLVAGLGLTAVSSLLLAHQMALRIIGGIFLLYLGVQIFRSRVHDGGAVAQKITLAKSYSSALFLTISNPATILSFLALFAGVGLGGSASYSGAASLVAGVFTGSASWWLFLSASVSRVRDRMTPDRLRWVNRLSGALIVGFAVVAFGMAARG